MLATRNFRDWHTERNLYKNVFRLGWKVVIEGTVRTGTDGVFHACEAATGNDSSSSESLIYSMNLTLVHSHSSEIMLFLMLMLYRGMADKCQRLEPGCSALYTWQNPMSERLLIWRCTDKNEDFENELTKVPCMNLLISVKCLSYLPLEFHFLDTQASVESNVCQLMLSYHDCTYFYR